MKRSEIHKGNRKSSLFNHVNRNIVYPTLFYNPHLDDEENDKNGVEIVELRSDEDSPENEQEDDHSWCNILERHEEYQDLNGANKISRDKRREINEKSNCESLNGSKYRDEEALNQFVSDFYGLNCYGTGERISTLNPHSQFFTIINNHKTPDTSSDSNQHDDIEVIQCENTKEMDYLNGNSSYDDRTFTYDNDGNAEKRTIWMYDLKNNRYFSEHDFVLINIPSKDSNSTTDDEDTSNDAPYIRRIATPIPRYTPKMNFSQSPSLPTVTEVSESNKQATNNSDVSMKIANANTHSPLQKHSSNWCKNKTTQTQTDNYNQNAENKNIKHENRNITTSKKEQQTQIYCEPTIVIRDAETSPILNIASFNREVHNIEIIEDDLKTTNKELSSENKIGRSSHESLCNQEKRHKKPNTHGTLKKEITDPLQKLDGNWIGETSPKDDEFLEVFDYHDEKFNEVLNEDSIDNEKAGGGFEDCASDSKPPEWTPYLPFGDSVPSLHLSISVDTDCGVKKKSWFKRLLQFFHCCK